MGNSVHYKSGLKNEIAFVFSCPGRKEKESDPPGPTKGETGKNLKFIISELSKKYENDFFSFDDVVITNSWPKVEFKSPGGSGRSEATIEEISEKKNLSRLSSQLGNISKYIFVCGKNAKFVLKKLLNDKKLKDTVKVFSIRHLGNRSVNQIKYDKNGIEIVTYSNKSQKSKDDVRNLSEIKQSNKLRRLEKITSDLIYKIDNGFTIDKE